MFKKIYKVLFAILFVFSSVFSMDPVIKGTGVVAAQAIKPVFKAVEAVDSAVNNGIQHGLILSSQNNPVTHYISLTPSVNPAANSAVAVPFVNQLPIDMIAERTLEQAAQANAQMANTLMLHNQAIMAEAAMATERLQLSTVANLIISIQNKAFCGEGIQNYASWSDYALQTTKENLKQDLPRLQSRLQDLVSQNPKIDTMINPEEYYLEPGYIPKDLTVQEVVQAREALAIKREIESRKYQIQLINHTLEQNERNFTNQLHDVSIDKINEEIMPNLIQQQQKYDQQIQQEETKLKEVKQSIKNHETALRELDQRFFLKKIGTGQYRKNLETHLQELKKVHDKMSKETLPSLRSEQKKVVKQIQYVQEVLDVKLAQEKQAQEALLAQEQQEAEFLQKQQEIECVYKEHLKNQYNALDFDNELCPDSVWCERQDALSKTEQNGYAEYDQEYTLSPQAEAFLQKHGMDSSQLQNFSGTDLQHQLHREYCNIIEQAAQKQAQLPYQSGLLKQCIACADAAYDANQLGQIQMVLSLNNLAFTLLEYGQSINKGLALTRENLVHTIKHPIQTLQSTGKALYYVLETGALNFCDQEDWSDDLAQLRDQRNAEIIAGLKNLGEKIANSTGPERVQALTQFAADFALSGAVTKVVGGVIGAAGSAAVKVTKCAQTELNASKTVQATATIVGKSKQAQEVVCDIAKAAQKAEVAAQEAIAQHVAQDLLNAEKQIDKVDKVVKSGISQSAQVINEFEQTLANLLKNTTPGEITKGKTKQFQKILGDYCEATTDFYNLKPSNVQKIPEGLKGILPDGRTINVRFKSKEGRPTLEIMKPGGSGIRIKIRYGKKNI